MRTERIGAIAPAVMIAGLAACQGATAPGGNTTAPSAGGGASPAGSAAALAGGVAASDPSNRLIGKWLAGPECGKDAGGRFEFTKTDFTIAPPDGTTPDTSPLTYTSITATKVSFMYYGSPFTAMIGDDDGLSLPLLPCKMHRVG